ncbi:50S ribosomal protein L11 methyltransferase [Sphingomonas naphthae]|uniref:Ribosomal protein L11 methyltransferase n=1 Tax=Sphingomonas naphthae TaxID=1813468 RepID=A0ABY7TIG3_9SPHN|nr:50S ribosomal protein L11 methyltransferase [Sphingomonas naphthae]WCT72993.1 50S ribosomal protein L11 methyltransferase [Sphingomonas naphthae]
MSAEWKTQAPQSWKLTLPCTKAEAERLAGEVPEIEILDNPPVLMTSEPDPDRPDDWQLDAYFEGEPEADALALVRSLVPSAAAIAAAPEPVEDQDWVTLSQAFLEPIRAGRFYVHTAAHAGTAPDGAVTFHIEAGRAFGTGHHETTTGCLEMLDRMAGEGLRFDRVIDVGTGTGLLAFAARALWPDARYAASDIDPISIDVTAENMAANAIPADAMLLVTAPGLDDPALQAAAPYDLVIANILAGPLIDLAPDLAGALAPGGSIVLAGLLDTQAEAVTAAYVAQGLTPVDRNTRGDWPTLRLRK